MHTGLLVLSIGSLQSRHPEGDVKTRNQCLHSSAFVVNILTFRSTYAVVGLSLTG